MPEVSNPHPIIERRVKLIKWGFTLLLLGVPLRLLWLQVAWRDALLTHPYNARLQERISERAAILDRNQVPIGYSKGEKRVYPEGELTAHWTGYCSLEYGVTGTEAWKNELLREHRDTVSSGIAGAGKPGRPVRLSLDLSQQRRLHDSFPRGQQGAAVMVDLDRGQVLAALSLPHYNPNRVGVEYRNWQSDLQAPTMSRFGLGLYPAGSLWTAYHSEFASLPKRPVTLLDWAGPHKLREQDWLVSPMSVAAVIQRLGSTLPLSQVYHGNRSVWQANQKFQSLRWIKTADGGWKWSEAARQSDQVVAWAIAVRPPFAVIMLSEDNAPKLGDCAERALPSR